MPNHVRHRIVCTGTSSDVAAFKNLMVVPGELPWDNSNFDFNRIIPRPEILDRVVAPVRKGDNGRTMLYEDAVNLIGPTREATEEEQKELDALPYPDWYTWSVEKWGTKWNSYDFGEVSDRARYEFVFDTAWSPPVPVFDELSEKFPQLSFDVAWFDEGWCHAGDGIIGSDNPDTSMDDIGCEPNVMVYEKVYGEAPDLPEEDLIPQEVLNRLMDNFTCEDVAGASDDEGNFPLYGTLLSTDPEMSGDELYMLAKSRD